MLFSIIIPVYNSEKYIKKCLESIMNQPFSDYELIIVDDGSTDGSLNIIKATITGDIRIKLLKKSHTNAGDARNMALEVAEGEWLIFIDADDFVGENYLYTIAETIRKKDFDIFVFGANYYDENSRLTYPIQWVYREDLLPKCNPFNANEYGDTLFQMFSTNIWNKVVKRDIVIKNSIRFSNLDDANDELFGCMILVHSEKIACSDDAIYNYRINTGISTQDRAMNKTSLCFIEALRDIRESLGVVQLFEIFKTSYYNKAIVECVNALLRENTWNTYKLVYDNIRSFLIDELKVPEKHYIGDEHYRNWLNYIRKNTVEELMFYFYSQNDWNEIKMKDWRLPYELIKGKKIVLFGAGNIGQSFYMQIQRTKGVKLVKWVDSNFEKYRKMGLDVFDISSIVDIEYDVILVAINGGKENRELTITLSEIANSKSIIFI
ncbi:Glycosyltransferase involved in cell wall bisynthesis [Pseudobutyrivibrio sp. YE44]|uniref:glycosyltransferase family 2 protein n=1 Tax=Pseudobutyrivibrio sp. YE44 TaxID=1520802 RepID=UPI00088BD41D|nr:glycosyltransferase family 2 protein [Pseudobutyrivibrio sp. YE44]SDB28890.1 Glycosyltransferase involved in cell wall bisynthesis [Pseudobutyrivibrio sp. YE44]